MMEEELIINGSKYVLEKESKVKTDKDTNDNQHCNNVVSCDNSTNCNNSTGCNNSTWCYNSTGCNNSTGCDNSTGCNNSTWCDNSAYLTYCNELVLEKHCLFNKQISKERYEEQKSKIQSELGYYKHPLKLTTEDKEWLKNNISEYDEKVLADVIKNSILPDKPKEE